MELKDQVCSLELAKKLKELGFKQDSLFWWHLPNEQEAFIVESKIDEYAISAYTVAELVSMLQSVERKDILIPIDTANASDYLGKLLINHYEKSAKGN